MIEVQGNGNIVSREISVSTFVRLHLGCKGIVELHQSDEEKVIVETDENLLDHFSAVNAGRTLYVSTQEKLRQPAFTSCVVKIFLRQLNILYVRNDHGNVICPNEITLTEPLKITVQSVGENELFFNVPSVKILCQAHGNTILKGRTGKLEIKNMSQGDLNASQLKAGELSIKNMTQGNVWLHADESISISHYGKGFIHYTGNAVVKDIKQYGDGEVKRIN
ncbi:MAG TPA: DUF2807 domain-containing protein [Bacteroidia bacterium]